MLTRLGVAMTSSHNADGPTKPIRYLLQLQRARSAPHTGIGRLGLIASFALAVHLLVQTARPPRRMQPKRQRRNRMRRGSRSILPPELNDSGVTGTATLYETVSNDRRAGSRRYGESEFLPTSTRAHAMTFSFWP